MKGIFGTPIGISKIFEVSTLNFFYFIRLQWKFILRRAKPLPLTALFTLPLPYVRLLPPCLPQEGKQGKGRATGEGGRKVRGSPQARSAWPYGGKGVPAGYLLSLPSAGR
uniref:Uncharacterized protein n=1 Tax=Udotea flabellum TaxID=170437 RepID=A0A386B1Y8_9CHLO|nr:hypothetical protein [Udotea flabellum]AYC65683.1 hypothetical protein [Udotea flabellum]